MRVPLSWLREFVDVTLPPVELAHLITMAGLEVAGIELIGLEGAPLPWDAEKILVANVLEVKPHPNADKLVLAEVDYGGPQPHTVVTGAPNLYPFLGQGRLAQPLKAVFAREGAKLYDGHKEEREIVTLKGRPVRGVLSDAMLCSEKELGISDEHEGILFLEADAPVGAPLRDVLGEVVIEIDITPNVARCLSIVGVAREVAALTGQPLRLPTPQVPMDGPPLAGRAQVTIDEPELCPRFTLSLIEGVQMGASPAWMQRRLAYAGMRPINAIVDISNYVMLEWGQPTHAFDADQVHERHLVVRMPHSGETLVTLDDKTRDLTPYAGDIRGPLLVADPERALSIAGVMGGASSEVHDQTTSVLLEAAIWEPSQIRRTARHFKLPSEASRRFERTVDIELPLVAQRRALELMQTCAGGTVAQGMLDVYPRPYRPLVIDLPPSEVRRIVGVTLSAEEIAAMLTALGFTCVVTSAMDMDDVPGLSSGQLDPLFVRVSVPSFRSDVSGVADLCEEAARMYGYDNVPATLLPDELPMPNAHDEIDRVQQLRDLLAGAGLSEVVTYSLTSMEAVAQVSPSAADAADYLRLSNASTPEREYLRRSLLPTLLDALAANTRERERVQLFEIGHVYLPRSAADAHAGWLPDEPTHLALALAGERAPLSWLESPNGTGAVLDFFDLKGVFEVMLAHWNLDDALVLEPLSSDERLHPGRAARVLLYRNPGGKRVPGAQPEPIGVLGELHPDVLERLELAAPRAAVLELNLDALLALVRAPGYAQISRYPAVVQDLAIVASDDVPEARIAALLRQSGGALLESLTLFDIYTGEQIEAGKRSLTYRLSFRAPDRTLSDDAVRKVRAKMTKLLQRELDASIRGAG